MSSKYQEDQFPALPIEEWEDTKNTLHLFLQIIGKIRLGTFPEKNHWWHVPFYVSTRGLTTGPIPYGDMIFEMEFDFFDHVLIISTSNDSERAMSCGTPVAALPVTGPIDVVKNGETGILHDDLATAATRALALDRAACRRFAEGHSWAKSTAQFVGHLAPQLCGAEQSRSAADS